MGLPCQPSRQEAMAHPGLFVLCVGYFLLRREVGERQPPWPSLGTPSPASGTRSVTRRGQGGSAQINHKKW